MHKSRKPAKDFNDYCSRFPKNVQLLLKQTRATIKKAAPGAEEIISYRIPAFRTERTLVWFAAHEKHIGLYPGASGITTFKKELAGYKTAKGSVQFPFEEPLPLDLIAKIVKFRAKEISS